MRQATACSGWHFYREMILIFFLFMQFQSALLEFIFIFRIGIFADTFVIRVRCVTKKELLKKTSIFSRGEMNAKELVRKRDTTPNKYLRQIKSKIRNTIIC